MTHSARAPYGQRRQRPKPFHSLDYIKTQERLDAYAEAIREAAIERCAQVVAAAAEGESEKIKAVCRWIAAAIRALKDKP